MSKLEVRCTCRRTPLLAICGMDDRGFPFIQVKQVKAGQITTHVLVTEGVARVQCRECLRWMVLRIAKRAVSAQQESLPSNLKV